MEVLREAASLDVAGGEGLLQQPVPLALRAVHPAGQRQGQGEHEREQQHQPGH